MYSQVTYLTSTTAVLSITDAGVLNVLSTPVIQGLIQRLSELAEKQRAALSCAERLGLAGFRRGSRHQGAG